MPVPCGRWAARVDGNPAPKKGPPRGLLGRARTPALEVTKPGCCCLGRPLRLVKRQSSQNPLTSCRLFARLALDRFCRPLWVPRQRGMVDFGIL